MNHEKGHQPYYPNTITAKGMYKDCTAMRRHSSFGQHGEMSAMATIELLHDGCHQNSLDLLKANTMPKGRNCSERVELNLLVPVVAC
eukprot:2429672-Amphidinium_carterae.1